MLRFGTRCIAILMTLTVISAAQCVSICAVSGCHHGDSIGSMHESQPATRENPQGHHGHEGPAPAEPMQHDDGCDGRSCGDHATYLTKANDLSLLNKLPSALSLSTLTTPAPVVHIDWARLLPVRVSHPPPHRDVGALTTILRI